MQPRIERAFQKRKMKVMTDEIIAVYMKDVDRTLLRENLRLTPTQRIEQLMEMQRFAEEFRRGCREPRTRREEAVARLILRGDL